MAKLPPYWDTFLSLSGKAVPATKRSSLESEAAGRATQFLEQGHLRLSPKEALAVPHYGWACFFRNIAEQVVQRGRIPSPVASHTDSSWMFSADYCFVNVRACGPHPEKPGTFLDAAKLLPSLRVSSIHMAPFFDCVFGNVYAIDTLEKIAPEVVDWDLAEKGLGEEDQLRIFIDAIHALGMTVGFDLEPHTSQFSRVVLSHPEHFRWLELAPDRKTLAGGLSQDAMLSEEQQKKIVAEVRTIVSGHLKQAGLKRLDLAETPNQEIKQVQGEMIQDLIAHGLWTLPSHTWGGAGLPEFVGYHKKDNYPLFEYLDYEGEDQGGHAFGMLTPIKFATGLLANTLPSRNNPAVPWEKGIDFFAGIFPAIRKRYPFDFVRLDYVDHVFDSVLEGTRDIPLADRPTPYVLERVIGTCRQTAPFLGAMAERMGYDLEDYRGVGFDLILGAEVIRNPDCEFISDMIRFTHEIAVLNEGVDIPASIQYAVDTHDTGHPEIDTNPAQYGVKGMLLRFFLARFGSCGKGRRPKYEVIGNADMTVGLYEANNKPQSLTWRDNQEFLSLYHSLEDVYLRFRSALDNSAIRIWQVEERYAVWYLDRQDGVRMRLMCLCYPDLVEETETIEGLRIFPFTDYWFDRAKVERVDLGSRTQEQVAIDPDGHISIPPLEPGDVHLYCISEA